MSGGGVLVMLSGLEPQLDGDEPRILPSGGQGNQEMNHVSGRSGAVGGHGRIEWRSSSQFSM